MIDIQTLDGAPLGMNRNLPQHEIADGNAWTLWDILIDSPGILRRRGPVQDPTTTWATKTSANMAGITATQQPAGTWGQLLLAGAVTKSSGNVTLTAWPYATADTGGFDAKAAAQKGVLIGTGSDLSAAPTSSALALYRGATKADVSNLSATIAIGDTVVSATTTNLCSGQHVFNHSTTAYIGVIKTIDSGSQFTLEAKAKAACTAIDALALRGINPRVSKGRITTDSANSQLNGGGTKWAAQGLATGTWDFFLTDGRYIGTVGSVQSDLQVTLDSVRVEATNADYIAIHRDGSYTIAGTYGWLNCAFAGHQFLAKGNRLYFSDLTDQEAFDLTEDGDWLTFSDDPIRGIYATTDELVVLTDGGSFVLSGAVGTTPDRWAGTPLSDDHCLGLGCSYEHGVIWAGRTGIWFYNGSLTNIGAAFDSDYIKFVSQTTKLPKYGIIRNHAVVWVQGLTGVFGRRVAAADNYQTSLQFVINLGSGAGTLWTNVELSNTLDLSDTVSGQTVDTVLGITDSNGTARVVSGSALFDAQFNDGYTCSHAAASGPAFYVESKRYDVGNPELLKLYKMLLLTYKANGGNLKLETLKGMNDTAELSPTQYLDFGDTWVTKRIKFMKRSQLLAFRLYQSDTSGLTPPGNAASTQYVEVGAWAIGFRTKRPGRV